MKNVNYLDWISDIIGVRREVYGYDFHNKPNDYCNWEVDVCGNMAWIENDEHFRWRLDK